MFNPSDYVTSDLRANLHESGNDGDQLYHSFRSEDSLVLKAIEAHEDL